MSMIQKKIIWMNSVKWKLYTKFASINQNQINFNLLITTDFYFSLTLVNFIKLEEIENKIYVVCSQRGININ